MREGKVVLNRSINWEKAFNLQRNIWCAS